MMKQENEVSQQRGVHKLLKIGLISCPIKLVNAVKPVESFKLVSPCHNARLEQERRCSICKTTISYEETIRAVGLTKDVNIALNAEELSVVKGVRESTDVNVLKVVNAIPVPCEKSYWVLPEKLFSVFKCLIQVLSQKKKVLFGSVVLRKNGKQNFVAIHSDGERLRMDILVEYNRIVSPPSLAPTVTTTERDINALSNYVETLSGTLLETEVDTGQTERLLSIVETKLSGNKPIIMEQAQKANDDENVFAALAQVTNGNN